MRRPRPAAELEDGHPLGRGRGRPSATPGRGPAPARPGRPTGELAVHLEDVAVAELFADVRRPLRRRPSPTPAGRWRSRPSWGSVRADRGRLTQALTNLVGNALEHGGAVVRLEARSQRRPGRPRGRRRGGRLRVRRCWSTGRSGSCGAAASTGAGLGLAIVATSPRRTAASAGLRNVEGGAEAWIAVPRSVSPQLGQQLREPSSRPAPLLAPPPRPSAPGSARSRESVRRTAGRAGRSRR